MSELGTYTRPRADGRSRQALAEQCAALRAEGLRYDEIAAIVGIAPSTASMYVFSLTFGKNDLWHRPPKRRARPPKRRARSEWE